MQPNYIGTCAECGEPVKEGDETVTPCSQLIHWRCESKHGDHCGNPECQGEDEFTEEA